MDDVSALAAELGASVQRDRLVETARQLVAVPSPTGNAGAVCDVLAGLLYEDGFKVERHAAGHTAAPAVVVRFETGEPGRTIQFNGHLDTVHLPFIPPDVAGELLTGSGASDMKSGVAAAVEALRTLRDSGRFTRGRVLLTAHDLHEAPWGNGSQLDQLIAQGIVGDAVLLPEPLSAVLPTDGRGQACWKVAIRRPGPPVHEVMRPLDEPSVIAAGAKLVERLGQLDTSLSRITDPVAGRASVFVGQLHSGEIYNQYPQECLLEGTRRWLPGTNRTEVEHEFRAILTDLANETSTTIETNYQLVRDAFHLDRDDPFVSDFQTAFAALSGSPLPFGPKPFVDDGNSFWALAGIPAITHGPRAGGQHTVHEWVSIDDLVRVAHLYALIAVLYCGRG